MSSEDGEYASLDAMPAVAPGGDSRPTPLTLEVDSETFELRHEGNGTHYAWVSGPNEGYGFGMSPTENCSLDDHRKFIRDFLRMIDPATGFIAD